MEKISKFLVPKRKKKELIIDTKRKDEEQVLRLALRLNTSNGDSPGASNGESLYLGLRDAMRTPRSPREVVQSPRPLSDEIMKTASPHLQKKRRASLNGEYIMGKELGKGSSGTVNMAINKKTGEIVAVKTVPKEILSEEAEIRLRREYAMMKVLNHPNLIKLTEVLENPHEIIIIMEYASQGDLFEYIVTQEELRLREDQAKPIFFQIALAVQYLHQHGFIHRDLKPENVLLGEGGRAFVADLGFGTSWHPKKLSKTQCGSLMYASPEIVGNKEYVGPEVDVWSMGVLLYAMTTGRHPFHGDDGQVRKTIEAGSFKMQPYFTEFLKDLLQGCLTVDRKGRLSIDEIVNHPWMADVADEWKAKARMAIGSSSDDVSMKDDDSCSSGGSGDEKKDKEKKRKKASPTRKFSFSWSREEDIPSSPTSAESLMAKRKKKGSVAY